LPQPLLICLDGEPHTLEAMAWAVRLADALALPLSGLHIKDPYLKQFQNDIYAQGRREYLSHVEDCLLDQAQRIGAEFTALCVQQGIAHDYRVREGEPLQEILAEYATGACQLLIVGGKPLAGLRRFRSRNLPARLEKRLSAPIMIVRSRRA